MKKRFYKVGLILSIAAALMSTSCIGKFALTNKLLAWNKTVGSKFVNEVVFFAFWILPVYEVSALADVLVINSIEFWSGDNPVAMGPRIIKGDTDTYTVLADATGYTVTAHSDGTEVRFDYIADRDGWDITLPDGSSHQLMTFIDDNHIALPGAAGTSIVVPMNEQGLAQYQALATAATATLAQR